MRGRQPEWRTPRSRGGKIPLIVTKNAHNGTCLGRGHADSTILILVSITAVAAVLRFSTLAVQGYWHDELVTVRLVDGSFGGMVSDIPSGETTPPLYYLLA